MARITQTPTLGHKMNFFKRKKLEEQLELEELLKRVLTPIVKDIINSTIREDIKKVFLDLQIPDRLLIQAVSTIDVMIQQETSKLFDAYKDQIKAFLKKWGN